jgi:hypothetical protein
MSPSLIHISTLHVLSHRLKKLQILFLKVPLRKNLQPQSTQNCNLLKNSSSHCYRVFNTTSVTLQIPHCQLNFFNHYKILSKMMMAYQQSNDGRPYFKIYHTKLDRCFNEILNKTKRNLASIFKENS